VLLSLGALAWPIGCRGGVIAVGEVTVLRVLRGLFNVAAVTSPVTFVIPIIGGSPFLTSS